MRLAQADLVAGDRHREPVEADRGEDGIHQYPERRRHQGGRDPRGSQHVQQCDGTRHRDDPAGFAEQLGGPLDQEAGGRVRVGGWYPEHREHERQGRVDPVPDHRRLDLRGEPATEACRQFVLCHRPQRFGVNQQTVHVEQDGRNTIVRNTIVNAHLT